MSDDEDESFSSPEEGFSASEDEWKPTKEMRGGESSDDDDSDFEGLPSAAGVATTVVGSKKREPKGRSATKQQGVKKRKTSMQSLRSKLYNKYKPPPKTFPVRGESNSPSASTSQALSKASKNAETPNDDSDNDNDSSDSSVEDYLVNPSELDLKSSFFDVGTKKATSSAVGPTPPPFFDCNAGAQLSDSGSEDNNESSGGGGGDDDEAPSKAFDFRNLLEKATNLERVKETMAKRAAAEPAKATSAAMDIESLLALGENKNQESLEKSGTRQKLRQTKSTRQKRHTKSKMSATAGAAANSDDSDWEEVADEDRSCSDDASALSTNHDSSAQAHDFTRNESLEIHVELPNKQRSSKDRKQQDLENMLKRKLNRNLKERQLLLHKTSLLCCFARSYLYNKLLNDTTLMQQALKLLPSKNSYPPDRGTELKYYQSLVTWFKTAIKLKSDNLYPVKQTKGGKEKLKQQLSEQLLKKEARCKQDMIFLFVILVRGMGLQCRLVVNMQPLPLRPAQSELCTIKLKKHQAETDGDKKVATEEAKKLKVENKLKSEEKLAKNVRDSEEKLAKVAKANKVSTRSGKEVAKKIGQPKGHHSEENAVNNQSTQEKKPSLQKKLEKEKQSASTRHRSQESKNKPQNATKLSIKHKDESLEVIEKKSRSNRSKERKEIPNEDREKAPVQSSILKSKSNKDNVIEDAKPARSKYDRGKRQVQPAIEENVAEKRQKFEAQRLENASKVQENAELMQKTKPAISKLKRTQTIPDITAPQKSNANEVGATPIASELSNQRVAAAQKPISKIGSTVLPKIIRQADKEIESTEKDSKASVEPTARDTRSRSKSPKFFISTDFLPTKVIKDNNIALSEEEKHKSSKGSNKATAKPKISPNFLKKNVVESEAPKRVLRTRQKPNDLKIPQLDGADDVKIDLDDIPLNARRQPQLKKLQKSRSKSENDDNDDADFEPSPPKRPKVAPVLKAVERLRKDRRILSTDDETTAAKSASKKSDPTAADMWIEVWSDVEDQWMCVDLFKGKLNIVDTIRKSATSSFAYVYAFQNDLSIKDITARYCPHWTTTVRKSRVDKAWLDTAISRYLGQRTRRDIIEDVELRRIHEEKPMPTAIGDFKDHPLYALERHLLKFQALYPPDAPTLGFIRSEPIYSRDCVHTLHSREIWLKQARTVKLGEQPYKVVKARPKWDRITQTVIKDQPLEIFGFWQTQDYEPPTAENGMVPRNAYGNVELFKACMLPKKTVHLQLSGLNRICKKLGIDCASAVTGFDFHSGACHPTYDGFVVCEEFADQVTAAWYQDQEEQEIKEQEKYEARVYGNWKKLIRGLLIRERLKRKYNF